jgi:4-amino-4-deoxy-L-arabinose transferase-like glycosyltransferase
VLIAIVLVAIAFRFAQFTQAPPGLHYDEAIDAKLARDVQAGHWSIYFEEGWGREPLYHYLVAFTLNFIPDSASALRFVSSLLGLGQLIAAYFLFRRLFGAPTALIGAAWIAVLFWTVSTSRAGLRNITLTTFATFTGLAFWSIWIRRSNPDSNPNAGLTFRHSSPALAAKRRGFVIRHSSFILPGILLGLTLYTYQPSRVVPFIYLAFVGYLFFVNRPLVKANWKSLAVFFLVAIMLVAPLIVFLATHPNAENSRAFQTEPIRALLSGDLSQVVETAVATLKMFTFEGGGDPQPIYNVSGQPIFVGVDSALFYLGLIVCLVRWRQPAYAFILIWLSVTLLVNMLTAPAPFFYRAIAAQTPVTVLPAIATVAIGDVLNRKKREERGEVKNAWRSLRSWRFILIILVAGFSLGQTAVTTQHDYFQVWGRDPAVRFQYSAAHTAIARALDASSDATPIAISGYFTEDADPYIFTQTLHRRDLSIRWFDARDALVAVAGATDQRLALPVFTPLDATLAARFLPGVEPTTQNPDFTLYSFDAVAFRADIAQWVGQTRTLEKMPIAFGDSLLLIGAEQPASIARVDSTFTLLTAWRTIGDGQPPSTAIFAHLLDAKGSLVAQDDRLGFPHHTWRVGDEFVQVHGIPVGDLEPGIYTLQIGVYTRADNVRWAARDVNGKEIGDRLLLGQVEVQP